MEKISVTIPEASALTGIGRTSLYEAFKAGQLTARKRGSRTLILVEDLKRYVESLPTSGDGEAA